MRRRYIPCTCYCSRCKRRHEGCVPEEDVKRLAVPAAEAPEAKAWYTAGHKAEYYLATNRLPRVECTSCYGLRVGVDTAERVAGMEADAMKWSKEHPTEGA